MEIHGTCKPQFEGVKAVFEENFEQRGDVGACVAVSVEGEPVVDLWAGYRDRARTLPWEQDTIVNVYSTTKTMAALTALLLADRGELDLYAPVKRYWPEFAQNGKDKVEVRHFLSHSAGLSGMDEPMSSEDVYDWEKMVTALARQAPWWEPGTASGYHALTQGHLIGEVVRRVTGASLGQVFRRELAEPLDADFHIGTGPERDHRIAELIPPEAAPAGEAKPGSPQLGEREGLAPRKNSIAARTFANPFIAARAASTRAWRAAEIPAANGHGNARSVMRVQTLAANLGSAFGKRLMSEAGCRAIFDEQTFGKDLVLGVPVKFGMGYGITTDLLPMGPNPNIAYWGGWGGSTAVIDLDARLCVSYVMNRMEGNLMGDLRGFRLLQAAHRSL
ncbi:MAG: serine hydrolase [Gammaproteobacteria bacterium]|nr:serine hydrolase [Gammaproteobacteria bacterium]MDE0269928.1 serine hydrolase [Gammaproteobacteria bacterium]